MLTIDDPPSDVIYDDELFSKTVQIDKNAGNDEVAESNDAIDVEYALLIEDNKANKSCKYLQERLPQLAFCEALKLDAYVHVENGTVDPVRKYQNIISNTQALVYSLFGAIEYSQIILNDLAKKWWY